MFFQKKRYTIDDDHIIEQTLEEDIWEPNIISGEVTGTTNGIHPVIESANENGETNINGEFTGIRSELENI